MKSACITVGMVALGALFLFYGCGPDLQMSRPAVRHKTEAVMLAREAMPGPGVAPQRFNTEAYDVIAESGFQSPVQAPLSTFSIDVDTAGYANVRRYLQDNSLPPAGAVRIEEMVNYFRYGYPPPEGDTPFSITTEVARSPWQDGHQLALIGLNTRPVALSDLPPMNLVFLLDVSGSMDMPDKLPLLKKSLRLLSDQLRKTDRVAMVVYAGAAGCVLPSTPGDRREEINAALEALAAGGSTAGAEGIQLAYRIAEQGFITGGNNRVILATDGDFNVGVSSDAALVNLIEAERRKGIYLTVLGFGTGNLKDAKMEKLADKGNGNYAYIDSLLEARKVLVREMGATLLTVAKDVKIQVEFNPAAVRAYRLIGYENRRLDAEDFNDDRKDAGEIGAGHSVTALYEIIPAGSDEPIPGVDPLKYQTTTVSDTARDSGELMTVKIRYKPPESDESRLLTRTVPAKAAAFDAASPDLRFAAAVAGFGLLLRDSQYKGTLTYDQVVAMARAAKGADPAGDRAEMIRLAERAGLLAR